MFCYLFKTLLEFSKNILILIRDLFIFILNIFMCEKQFVHVLYHSKLTENTSIMLSKNSADLKSNASDTTLYPKHHIYYS